MCGIAGILLHADRAETIDEASLRRMRDQLKHRGPDGDRIWIAPHKRAGLVHTRLSIVDLHDTGAQPMVSADGRYEMVFNGEIYNYLELRRELEAKGHQFRGTSDSEVLLQLFAEQGMRCLNLLDGMFAFAVYDTQHHQLWLARDPLGEKPLYVTERDGLFAFASEVRALVAAGVASAEPDLEGIGYLLRQGSVPPPYTHLRDVRFLRPAQWHHVDSTGRRSHSQRYWSVPFVAEDKALADGMEALERLRATLHSSVSLRGRADVPVGAFLSGGVDSSAVCAVLVDAGFTNLRTFTVTLPGHSSDECKQARAIAAHLGIEHTEIPLAAHTGGQWLEQALLDMDVPSIDGPNTWLVSKAVHDAGMKVACSGIGGDELFFGYPSFNIVPHWLKHVRPLSRIPGIQQLSASIALKMPAIHRWSRMLDALVAGGSLAALWFAKRGLFSAAELRELLTDAVNLKVDARDPILRLEQLGCPTDLSPERQVSFYELRVYLHDQLLRDTDAMSMAHSLEVRAPLIARPLVELVAGLAATVQFPCMGKSLLRRAVADRIPDALLGKKQGFTLDWKTLTESRVNRSSERALSGLRGILKPGALFVNPHTAHAVPPDLVLEALGLAIRQASDISPTEPAAPDRKQHIEQASTPSFA